MSYLEIKFSPVANEEIQSLLIADLFELGFDSFNQEENALLAYISDDIYHEDLLKEMLILENHSEINITIGILEDKNWNKEWESNYQPVTIAGKCYVRAPFHPPHSNFSYEIVIEPKMAFGTAHHETTSLMAEWLMKLDVRGKMVMDMGCGTGILAILANKMGASGVIGIDNDEWAWRNARENFRINGLDEELVYLGDASLIQAEAYDIILANINRNVLLQDIKEYSMGLRTGGQLLLSGFYQRDAEAIQPVAFSCNLKFIGMESLHDWTVLLLNK